MSIPVYYLSNLYTGMEEESFANAVRWTYELRQKGHVVFSPILHTHQFHKEFVIDWQSSMSWDKADEEMNKRMKYVEWDLALLKALMAGDGMEKTCPQCGSPVQLIEGKYVCKLMNRSHVNIIPVIRYDSGVVLLLDEGAFVKKEMFDPDGYTKEWVSDGCRQEYEFAKANHIRVLSHQAFLKREEKEL